MEALAHDTIPYIHRIFHTRTNIPKMKQANNGKAEIARTYRRKHGNEMPTRQLAKLLFEENQAKFKDLEDARWALR